MQKIFIYLNGKYVEGLMADPVNIISIYQVDKMMFDNII